MRTPKRKPGKYALEKKDFHITENKYNRLKAELERLEKIDRPPAIKEVKRLALMGDFSENAAYQIAKGKLRSINRRILKVKDFLNHAEIIRPGANKDVVGLGSKVTLESEGKEKKYQILGSAETNPERGIISQNSPLGKALLGKGAGQKVEIKLPKKTTTYKIIKIE